MYIYNVTINVENEIEKDWVGWMKNVHIPNVIDTGYFTGHRFLHLLTEVPDATGVTYAVQYFADSQEAIDSYFEKDAPRLRQEVQDRYQGKFVSFRTVLKEV